MSLHSGLAWLADGFIKSDRKCSGRKSLPSSRTRGSYCHGDGDVDDKLPAFKAFAQASSNSSHSKLARIKSASHITQMSSRAVPGKRRSNSISTTSSRVHSIPYTERVRALRTEAKVIKRPSTAPQSKRSSANVSVPENLSPRSGGWAVRPMSSGSKRRLSLSTNTESVVIYNDLPAHPDLRYFDRHSRCFNHAQGSGDIRASRPSTSNASDKSAVVQCECCGEITSQIRYRYGPSGSAMTEMQANNKTFLYPEKIMNLNSSSKGSHRPVSAPSRTSRELPQQNYVMRGNIPHFCNFVKSCSVYSKRTGERILNGSGFLDDSMLPQPTMFQLEQILAGKCPYQSTRNLLTRSKPVSFHTDHVAALDSYSSTADFNTRYMSGVFTAPYFDIAPSSRGMSGSISPTRTLSGGGDFSKRTHQSREHSRDVVLPADAVHLEMSNIYNSNPAVRGLSSSIQEFKQQILDDLSIDIDEMRAVDDGDPQTHNLSEEETPSTKNILSNIPEKVHYPSEVNYKYLKRDSQVPAGVLEDYEDMNSVLEPDLSPSPPDNQMMPAEETEFIYLASYELGHSGPSLEVDGDLISDAPHEQIENESKPTPSVTELFKELQSDEAISQLSLMEDANSASQSMLEHQIPSVFEHHPQSPPIPFANSISNVPAIRPDDSAEIVVSDHIVLSSEGANVASSAPIPSNSVMEIDNKTDQLSSRSLQFSRSLLADEPTVSVSANRLSIQQSSTIPYPIEMVSSEHLPDGNQTVNKLQYYKYPKLPPIGSQHDVTVSSKLHPIISQTDSIDHDVAVDSKHQHTTISDDVPSFKDPELPTTHKQADVTKAKDLSGETDRPLKQVETESVKESNSGENISRVSMFKHVSKRWRNNYVSSSPATVSDHTNSLESSSSTEPATHDILQNIADVAARFIPSYRPPKKLLYNTLAHKTNLSSKNSLPKITPSTSKPPTVQEQTNESGLVQRSIPVEEELSNSSDDYELHNRNTPGSASMLPQLAEVKSNESVLQQMTAFQAVRSKDWSTDGGHTSPVIASMRAQNMGNVLKITQSLVSGSKLTGSTPLRKYAPIEKVRNALIWQKPQNIAPIVQQRWLSGAENTEDIENAEDISVAGQFADKVQQNEKYEQKKFKLHAVGSEDIAMYFNRWRDRISKTPLPPPKHTLDSLLVRSPSGRLNFPKVKPTEYPADRPALLSNSISLESCSSCCSPKVWALTSSQTIDQPDLQITRAEISIRLSTAIKLHKHGPYVARQSEDSGEDGRSCDTLLLPEQRSTVSIHTPSIDDDRLQQLQAIIQPSASGSLSTVSIGNTHSPSVSHAVKRPKTKRTESLSSKGGTKSMASGKKKEWVLTDSNPMIIPPPAEATTSKTLEQEPVQEHGVVVDPLSTVGTAPEEKTSVPKTQSHQELSAPALEKTEENKAKWERKVGRGAVKDEDWMSLDAQERLNLEMRMHRENLALTSQAQDDDESQVFGLERRRKPQVKMASWMSGRLALSKQACRFELPIDMRLLEKMTPLEYLQRHCVVTARRRMLYEKIYNKQRDGRTGKLSFNDLQRALTDVLIHSIDEEKMKLVIKMLHIPEDIVVDKKLFYGIAAFSERLLYPLYAKRSEQTSVNGHKEMIESADFYTLEWKFHGVNVNNDMRTIFEVL